MPRFVAIFAASLTAIACSPTDSTSSSGDIGSATAADSDAETEAGNGGESGDGASGSTGADAVPPDGRYHPEDFAQAQVHGEAAKLQEQDCRTCHGTDLTGIASNGPSCDGCHQTQWRTDCTYCHGGEQGDDGAPPRDIDGSSDPGGLSFRAHTAHVLANGTHGAFDCTQCHSKPTDVLSLEHMFDDTPAFAEVDFSGGLSAAGQYAAGSCGNLYCHGTGKAADGVAQDGMPSPGCGGCHGYSESLSWSAMSGRHSLHLGEGIACASCHGEIVTPTGFILDTARHVDGEPQVTITEGGVTFDGEGCTGLCHLKLHFSETW